MEFFEGLRGWFSRSGAPWRPYRDASGAPGALAVAGGPSLVVSQNGRWPQRASERPAAANDPAPSSSGRTAAKSPHTMITASRVKGATVRCGDDGDTCRIHDLSIDKKSGRIDYVLVHSTIFSASPRRSTPCRGHVCPMIRRRTRIGSF
jgi:hypothetical protein